MCGIAFIKGNELHRVLGRQRERGLDGVGFVSEQYLGGFKGFHSPTDKKGIHYTEQERFKRYVQYLQEIVKKYSLEDSMCLFHHRKASVGSTSIENTHPFCSEKFSVMQNGTERDLRKWGDVEGIDKNKTDTYCLLQYLNKKAKTLHQVVDLLDFLANDLRMSLGVIFVIDNKNKKILFYSDGTRESYISFGEEKETIDMIESWHGNDRKKAHKNTGWMIFNFKGKISDRNLKDPNAETVSKSGGCSYTDDDGTTQYLYNYNTNAFNNKVKNHSGLHQYELDYINEFITKLKQSINIGDVEFHAINSVPWHMRSEFFKNKKELKKFRRMYEQALRRAFKFSFNKRRKLDDIVGISSTEAKNIFEEIIEHNKKNRTTDNISELEAGYKIDEDIAVHNILKEFDNKVKSKDIYDEDDSIDIVEPNNQTTLLDTKYPDTLDDDASDMWQENWIKFQEFIGLADAGKLYATEADKSFAKRYPTIITNIDSVRNVVTLKKQVSESVSEYKDVRLLVCKDTGRCSVIDSLNGSKLMYIKINWDNGAPILCPEPTII